MYKRANLNNFNSLIHSNNELIDGLYYNTIVSDSSKVNIIYPIAFTISILII